MLNAYFEPTEAAAIILFSQKIEGELVMLNLLRFKQVADYSSHPELTSNRDS